MQEPLAGCKALGLGAFAGTGRAKEKKTLLHWWRRKTGAGLNGGAGRLNGDGWSRQFGRPGSGISGRDGIGVAGTGTGLLANHALIPLGDDVGLHLFGGVNGHSYQDE